MKTILYAAFVLGLLLPGSVYAASPTVVELYQSQGCSSCPPAIAAVNAIADRPDILALTFAVTYWDQLGWKDTFASPAFTARQYDYAHGLGHRGVYTPQVVINGRSDLVGAARGELNNAVEHAVPVTGPVLSREQDSISVSGIAAKADADVWLVRYDPRILNVPIGAGENNGVTIAHRNVVRGLVRLGTWAGKAQSFQLPPAEDTAWRAAILVQAKNGGPILAALKL